MKKYDQISSVVWLIFAAYICVESLRLPFGSFRDPGPGFMPLLAGIFLGISSGIAFLHPRLNKPAEIDFNESWFSWKKGKESIWVLAALYTYFFALNTLGFLITTFILLLFLFRRGSRPQRWAVAIGESAVISFSSYAIFELWLRTQLPKGILGF